MNTAKASPETTTKIQVYLSPEVKQRLMARAKASNRTISNYVAWLIIQDDQQE